MNKDVLGRVALAVAIGAVAYALSTRIKVKRIDFDSLTDEQQETLARISELDPDQLKTV